jgi:hypothetical protein
MHATTQGYVRARRSFRAMHRGASEDLQTRGGDRRAARRTRRRPHTRTAASARSSPSFETVRSRYRGCSLAKQQCCTSDQRQPVQPGSPSGPSPDEYEALAKRRHDLQVATISAPTAAMNVPPATTRPRPTRPASGPPASAGGSISRRTVAPTGLAITPWGLARVRARGHRNGLQPPAQRGAGG